MISLKERSNRPRRKATLIGESRNWRRLNNKKDTELFAVFFSFTPLNGGGPIRSRHYEYYYTQYYMRVYIYIKIIKGRYYGREKQSSRTCLYKNIGPKT